MADAGAVRVRCPNPACAAELAVAPERLGKNQPCPACGQVITVVPIALRERAHQERTRTANDLERNCMPLVLVLENIRSLWNVGSIFRSADGAGVQEIWLCGYTGRPPRDEISKTALGAELTVPWHEAARAADAASALRSRGFHIVALEATRDSSPLAKAAPEFPCALLVGNEVAGLTEEALSLASAAYHIPMHGLKSSLNVAVATGIAVYQLRLAAERAGAARPNAGGA
jgi:23S rRNA (guanosine2251-2'-O)-methyltransferase